MRVKILKAITYLMILVFLLAASAVDSESFLPLVALFISGTWIWLICKANYERWS